MSFATNVIRSAVPVFGSCLSPCNSKDMYPMVVARPRYRFYSEGLEYVQYPLDSTCFSTPCWSNRGRVLLRILTACVVERVNRRDQVASYSQAMEKTIHTRKEGRCFLVLCLFEVFYVILDVHNLIISLGREISSPLWNILSYQIVSCWLFAS